MDALLKTFVRINAFIYKLTNGRLGSQMGKQSVLLLHTIGRTSGKQYVNPLSYYRDGKNYLIVASNWGKESPPDWFRNLMRQSRTTIQVNNATLLVEPKLAEGPEYLRLWELVTRQNSQYVDYQKGIARKIPIVILTPLSAD
jgi:F420H(2)-dependent quinone reductase